jgi:hypothetical protein
VANTLNLFRNGGRWLHRFVRWLVWNQAHLLDNDLRDVRDLDFRFPVVKRDLSRYSHGFALVLLRIRELPRARRRYPSREGLIGVFTAHVQKNIAFAGLMNSVHSVCDRCYSPNVLCRFGSRVNCRVLRNG